MEAQMIKQNLYTTVVALKYIAPDELINEMLQQKQLNDDYILKTKEGEVKFLVNKSTNQILLSGDSLSVLDALNKISFLDVAPRQIVIEAKIVELNNERMEELGIDWQELLDRTGIYSQGEINITGRKSSKDDLEDKYKDTQYGFRGIFQTGMAVSDLLKLIQDKSIGKITNIPRIVTINNRAGILLDGSRITYVARYSSYANIYETDELTAGLYLEVTPSLGESDYLKLDVNAKLTNLGEIIGGSPSELGQQVKNTVYVKNGEEFMLGSFKKIQKIKIRRKIPILGTLLPFLFSTKSEVETYRDFLVILKPQVIDFSKQEIPKIEER